MTIMRRTELASKIDYALLGPDISAAQVKELCKEASRYKVACVCVNPCHVALAKSELKDSSVKVCTVIGFPHGANHPEAKVFEAKQALLDGADELDMVINISALKSKDYRTVLEEIRAVREETRKGAKEILLKAILETALLNEEEKVAGCILAKAGGADFVKTSTGFGPAGATIEDVALMRKTVGAEMGIKASGGIKDYETALAMLKAGANRLGTSAAAKILQEAPA